MPKTGKHYDIQIAFNAPHELREKLIALAYLRGQRGKRVEYAPFARDILADGLDQMIADLDPHELKEYKGILQSVQSAEVVDKMVREEKRAERLKAQEPSVEPLDEEPTSPLVDAPADHE